MGGISLRIVKPSKDERWLKLDKSQDTLPVSFQGEVTGGVVADLYYRWYSSLNSHAQPDHYALREDPMHDTTLRSADQEVKFELGMGSHVITFAATDQPGESAAETRAVSRGGVTGGAEEPHACLVNILKARLFDLAPQQPVATLTLSAEAPRAWASKAYQSHNRLHYRWVLKPQNSQSGGATLEFKPGDDELTFIGTASPYRVVFTPPQPLSVSGQYLVTLYVGDPSNQAEDSQAVEFIT